MTGPPTTDHGRPTNHRRPMVRCESAVHPQLVHKLSERRYCLNENRRQSTDNRQNIGGLWSAVHPYLAATAGGAEAGLAGSGTIFFIGFVDFR